jgi:rhodanese-related sulfurtransferase
MMNEFLMFVSQEWMLVSALLVLIGLFLWTENVRAGESISVHQLTAQVNNANGLVLDLRDNKEFKEGHIVDAINIPFAKLAESMSQLEIHKARPLVLVDKMGQHTGSAGRTLKQAGYQVSRLNGGMSEWTGSSLPVVKGA